MITRLWRQRVRKYAPYIFNEYRNSLVFVRGKYHETRLRGTLNFLIARIRCQELAVKYLQRNFRGLSDYEPFKTFGFWWMDFQGDMKIFYRWKSHPPWQLKISETSINFTVIKNAVHYYRFYAIPRILAFPGLEKRWEALSEIGWFPTRKSRKCN